MEVNYIIVMKYVSYLSKMNTKILLTEFGSLPIHEKERIIDLLIDQLDQHEGQLDLVMKELESSQIKAPSCIYCESTSTIKRARIRTIQRYSCNECGKYWMATHGTSLAGLHKRNLWQSYVLAFEKGYSIRRAAQELGISVQTSFRWRHRLLASISEHLPNKLSGIIETADFQLPRNTKGQRKAENSPDSTSGIDVQLPSTISVLLSTSRNTHESCSNVIAADLPNAAHIGKALHGKIQTGATLITPALDAFNFLKEKDFLQYIPVSNRGNLKRKETINLDTARSQYQAFKAFLTPFHGVATKYLQNYLNWYHHKEHTKMRLDKIRYCIRACFTGDQALAWLDNLTNKDTVIIT